MPVRRWYEALAATALCSAGLTTTATVADAPDGDRPPGPAALPSSFAWTSSGPLRAAERQGGRSP